MKGDSIEVGRRARDSDPVVHEDCPFRRALPDRNQYDVEPGDAGRARILNRKVEVTVRKATTRYRHLTRGNHSLDLVGIGRRKLFGVPAAANL